MYAHLGTIRDESRVIGAGQAAVKNLARRYSHALVYLYVELPLQDMLDIHLLRLAVTETHQADVVFVGLDRQFNYKKLTGAVLAIRGGAHFIAVNRDALLPVAGGFLPGCGTMAAAIEAGSGVTPEVVGKPQPTLLQEAMQMLGSTPNETVMIGDGLAVDIRGGQAAGTHTLLVLSGKDSLEDVAKSSVKPEYIYQDVGELVKELKRDGS